MPRRAPRAVLCLALAGALVGCGDDSKDSTGVAGLSESYYAASNLEPALESIRTQVGEKAIVKLTVTQDAVVARAQPKQGGPETITVKPSSASGSVREPDKHKVIGPELDDVDPETVQELVSQVADEANVEEDNVTSIATLSAQGTDAGWVVLLDDGGRWQAALDGSDLKQLS